MKGLKAHEILSYLGVGKQSTENSFVYLFTCLFRYWTWGKEIYKDEPHTTHYYQSLRDTDALRNPFKFCFVLFFVSCRDRNNCVNVYVPYDASSGCFFTFLKLSAAMCCALQVSTFATLAHIIPKLSFFQILPLRSSSFFGKAGSSRYRAIELSVPNVVAQFQGFMDVRRRWPKFQKLKNSGRNRRNEMGIQYLFWEEMHKSQTWNSGIDFIEIGTKCPECQWWKTELLKISQNF